MEHVLKAFRKSIAGRLRRFRLTEEESEDVIQEGMLALWIASLASKVENSEAYLWKCARNEAISLLRGRAFRKRFEARALHEDDLRPSDPSTEEGRRKDLREARIELVRELLREHAATSGDDVLVLRYVDGLRLRRIASLRRRPMGTVSSQVNAARIPMALKKRLREELADLDRQEEARIDALA